MTITALESQQRNASRSDVYFVALAGAAAGVAAWFLARAIIVMDLLRGNPWADLLACILVGLLVPASGLWVADYRSGNPIVFRWTAMTAFIGFLAGLAAGILIGVINKAVGPTPSLFRILSWAVIGISITVVVGLARRKDEEARALFCTLGGIAGGVVGAITFVGLGRISPGFNEALGYSLLGAGIAFGLTYAPALVRTATLTFVRSDDPKTRNTLGKARKSWSLDEERQYIIGSMAPLDGGRQAFASVDIYIPDPLVAGRHATVYFRRGRPFIALHEENRGAAGSIALFVAGRSVTQPRQLADRDEIKLGRTILRFDLRITRNDGAAD